MGSPVKPREWEKTLTVKCRLCGGAKCKRCSESAALAKTDSPIRGLHADWVTDRILGMMRPSSRLMKDYGIARQFHTHRIAAVFNLTLPGEHPYCGDGLGPSGFPYDPERDLMAEQIQFYNFGWEDMTTPSLSLMLDIVKVMASVLQDGRSKVAVHCHAGYGRTGLAIACCLLFLHGLAPDRAIAIVRRDRPGSIQTKGQAKFVRSFHEYVNESRVVFALPFLHERFSVAETVEHQSRGAHGDRARGATQAVPRVLEFLCREVERSVEREQPLAVVEALLTHVPSRHHDARRVPPSEEGSGNREALERQLQRLCGERGLEQLRGLPGFLAVSGAASTTSTGEQSRERSSSPPPVPSSLPPTASASATASAAPTSPTPEGLFPVKTAFNVGEWCWPEALRGCPSPGPWAAALLLDWLEHLREPVLPVDVAVPVTTSENEAGAMRWRSLNQLPTCVVKSLDRVLGFLRVLFRRLEVVGPPIATTTTLIEALIMRAAMALFHLESTAPGLPRHAEFVHRVIREWQPPKRLELNLETLQKIGRSPSPSARRPSSALSHAPNGGNNASSGGGGGSCNNLLVAHVRPPPERSGTPPKSPSRLADPTTTVPSTASSAMTTAAGAGAAAAAAVGPGTASSLEPMPQSARLSGASHSSHHSHHAPPGHHHHHEPAKSPPTDSTRHHHHHYGLELPTVPHGNNGSSSNSNSNGKEGEPSPVRMEALNPRLIETARREKDNGDADRPATSPQQQQQPHSTSYQSHHPSHPSPHQHHHHELSSGSVAVGAVAAVGPLPLAPVPPALGSAPGSPEPRCATPPPSSSSPQALVRQGSNGGNSPYSLPSVKGGERYKNRQP